MTGIAAKLRAAGYRTVMSGKVRFASIPYGRQWGARMANAGGLSSFLGRSVWWCPPRCYLLVFMFSI